MCIGHRCLRRECARNFETTTAAGAVNSTGVGSIYIIYLGFIEMPFWGCVKVTRLVYRRLIGGEVMSEDGWCESTLQYEEALFYVVKCMVGCAIRSFLLLFIEYFFI